MAKKDTVFEEEFGAVETVEAINTEAPVAAEKLQYALADGSMGSRAAFIREKFIDGNMSRKQIEEEFGIPYRAVYSATVNMYNDAEPTARGRSAGSTTIQVNDDNKLVTMREIDGNNVVYVQGEPQALVWDEIKDTLTNKSRTAWITEQVEAGVSRGDLAKMLDVSYGVVYAATKDLSDGSGRVKHEITKEDGTVVSRSEYIRELAAAGMERAEIAKQLDIPYTVVYQATKVEKTLAEKFTAAVEALATYESNVSAEHKEFFADALATLRAVVIEDEAKAEAAEATEDAE